MSVKTPSLYKMMQKIALPERKRQRAASEHQKFLQDMPAPKMYRNNEGRAMYPDPEDVESRDEEIGAVETELFGVENELFGAEASFKNESEIFPFANLLEEFKLPSESDFDLALDEEVACVDYVSRKKAKILIFTLLSYS